MILPTELEGRQTRYDSGELLPFKPTFYVFKGVSGAGCSTAIDEMVKKGLVQLSPPEFTTRPLRPDEVKGHRHHSITKQQLDMVRHQVSTLEPLFGNEYGFFKPAIRKMQKVLASRNVVVDSNTPPQVWQEVIGNYPIISVFFAPQNPRSAIDRIVSRATKQQDPRVNEYLLVRAQDNVKIMQGIHNFDYWVDTTTLETVFPTVEAIIHGTSYSGNLGHIQQFRINTGSGLDTAEELISRYEDPTNIDYARNLLGL